MNPWQLFWAPQFHFPFGGSVAQRIEPNTNWFFGSIQPGAGDAAVEQKAFEIASYGRQLGLITEILLDIVERAEPTTAEGRKALKDLQKIRTAIEDLKDQNVDMLAADVEFKVNRIRKRDKAKARELNKKISNQLNEPDA